MCGMKVVVVNSDENGNIDLEDLKAKALKHKDTLVRLLYPPYLSSTLPLFPVLPSLPFIVFDFSRFLFIRNLSPYRLVRLLSLLRLTSLDLITPYLSSHLTFSHLLAPTHTPLNTHRLPSWLLTLPHTECSKRKSRPSSTASTPTEDRLVASAAMQLHSSRSRLVCATD
jgi:hypothetical protein